MSARYLLKQGILVFLLAGLLFISTACNRQDNGVAPTQAQNPEVQSPVSFKPPLALIEAATGPIFLDSLPENPPSPTETLSALSLNGISPKVTTTIPATIKALVAPSPSGPNLALSATPSASSYWPWAMPYGPGGSYIMLTPNRAINQILTDFWSSSFWASNHYYQLSWAQPVTVNRIFMTKEYGHAPHVMQTVQQIKYFDPTTSTWQTFLNSGGTFSGGAGNYDRTFTPVTTTGIMVYLNTGPVNPHPNWCVWIDEIEVYGNAVVPKVSKIEFSGSALNRIFDRKNHQFLDPPHWLATIQSGQVNETKNSSFSYIIDSPISLKPEFVSEDGTPLPANSSFDVELTGQVKDLIGGEPDRALTFTTKSWSGSPIEMTSNEALQTKVGIWGLELNWVFKKSGSQLGNQRTPKATTYHCVFTTWKATIDNGIFDVGSKAESMPTQYLEIIKLSSFLLKGTRSSASSQTILETIQDQAWSQGGYKYLGGKSLDGETRGIDRILDKTTGLCEEFSQLYHALAESQGVDVYAVAARLPLTAIKQGYRLIPEDVNLAAFGGDTQITTGNWQFSDHMYNSLTGSDFLDFSFNKRGIAESDFLDNTFDLYDSSKSPYTPITPNPYSENYFYLADLD